MTNDGSSLLVPHCVRCAFREAPVLCTRCEANEYCSEIHQKDDTQRHRKGQCRAVIAAREKLREAEAMLRSEPSDGMFLPDDVFENGVGDFYAIHETRAYMGAKYELVKELANIGSYSGVVNALEEASDALRLDHQDHLSLREPVPACLILLGRLQETYDFIRYWATVEDDEDDEMDDDTTVAPCFRKRGADMKEPVEMFLRSQLPVLHLCGLVFIKIILLFGIRGAIQKLTSDDPQSQTEAFAFLESNGLPTDQPSLTTLENTLIHQAAEISEAIERDHKFFWTLMQLPKTIHPDVRPWHTLYADMFHWFPPSLDGLSMIRNARREVQAERTTQPRD